MNPAASQLIRHALGYIAQVLPCGLLLYFSFREQLRYSERRTLAAIAGTLALSALAFVLVALATAYDSLSIRAAFYVLIVLFLAPYFALVKGRRSLLLFAYIMVFCYGVHIATAELVLSVFLPFADQPNLYDWVDILGFTLLACASARPFYQLLKRLIAFAAGNEKNSFLRNCCITIGLYTLATSVAVLYMEDLVAPGPFLLLVAAVFIGTIVIYYFLYFLLSHLSEWEQTAAWASIAESQIELQKAQYQQLADTIEQTRKARHDLRHHAAVVKTFAEQGNIEALKHYLAEYVQSLPEATAEPLCHNYIIDIIARHYLSIARAEGAECTVRLVVPKELPIADMDLCIVLGNCLENALEACRKIPKEERRIHLAARIKDFALVITLDNSFDGVLPKAHSTKPQGGLGLRNVRTVVEKYGGQAIFRAEGKTYQSNIVMVIPSGAIPSRLGE